MAIQYPIAFIIQSSCQVALHNL